MAKYEIVERTEVNGQVWYHIRKDDDHVEGSFTRELERGEYLKCLSDKLIEEAKEVIQAEDEMEIAQELADVLEVINAIAIANNLSFQDIEDARLKKKAIKGGFEKGIYCSFIEMTSDHQQINYYLSKAEEYPEVK